MPRTTRSGGCNEALLARWSVAAGRGGAVNLTHDLGRFTLEVMLQAILGEDLAGLVQLLMEATDHERPAAGSTSARCSTRSSRWWWLATRPTPARSTGTDVFVSPYVVHRHPAIWENAHAFDPGRFAAGRGDARPNFADIPFGAGPRHCIGESLSLLEMMLHLNGAARRFRLRPVAPGPVALEARINLRPAQDVHMRVEKR